MGKKNNKTLSKQVKPFVKTHMFSIDLIFDHKTHWSFYLMSYRFVQTIDWLGEVQNTQREKNEN